MNEVRFGKIIEALRLAKGMSQSELASEMDASLSIVQRIEAKAKFNDVPLTRPGNFRRLAEVLGARMIRLTQPFYESDLDYIKQNGTLPPRSFPEPLLSGDPSNNPADRQLAIFYDLQGKLSETALSQATAIFTAVVEWLRSLPPKEGSMIAEAIERAINMPAEDEARKLEKVKAAADAGLRQLKPKRRAAS
jgi:ribosome-binding protein aMBF1 (putative translation factor)